MSRFDVLTIITSALEAASSVIEGNKSLPNLGITIALGLTFLIVTPVLYLIGLGAFALVSRKHELKMKRLRIVALGCC